MSGTRGKCLGGMWNCSTLARSISRWLNLTLTVDLSEWVCEWVVDLHSALSLRNPNATLIYDTDFQSTATCGLDPHTHAKIQGKRWSAGSKDRVETGNKPTDRRIRPISLPSSLVKPLLYCVPACRKKTSYSCQRQSRIIRLQQRAVAAVKTTLDYR